MTASVVQLMPVLVVLVMLEWVGLVIQELAERVNLVQAFADNNFVRNIE